MVTAKNYYSVLEVSEKASQEDIKRAYRKLALKCHPDTSRDTSDPQLFRDITEAYEILKDPDKKENYDQRLKTAIFKPARIRRGSDIKIPVKITVDDIAKEITKNIITSRKAPCIKCAGTGSSTKKMILCSECRGSGIDVVSSVMGPKKFCADCKGYGNYPENKNCDLCGGTGLTAENISKQIVLSRNFQPVLTFIGSGNYPAEAGHGCIFGDLIVALVVEKSCPFEVEGINIKGPLKISPAQAVIGDTIFLDVFGEIVKIDVPSGTRHGESLETEKAGITKGNRKGKLILKINIDVPKKISEEEKDLYMQLLKIQKGYL